MIVGMYEKKNKTPKECVVLCRLRGLLLFFVSEVVLPNSR